MGHKLPKDFFKKWKVTDDGLRRRSKIIAAEDVKSISKFLAANALEKLYDQTEDLIRAKTAQVIRNKFGIGTVTVFLDENVVPSFMKWMELSDSITTLNSDKVASDKKLFAWYDHETETRSYSLQDSDANGTIFFLFKDRKFSLCSGSREIPEGQGTYRETSKKFRIETDIKNHFLIEELIEEFKTRSSKTPPSIRIHSEWGSWTSLPSAPRPIGSVVLPKGEVDRLLKDVKNFFDSQDKYYEKGLLWKRGYMLTGPPGGGKTSLIRAVATEFNLDVYHIMSSSLESDISLARLMSDIPSRSLIVFEDLDAIEIANSREDTNGTRDKLTTSGLLNVIDGMFSPEGSLIFVTTNHPEKLDSALTRPGRIDYRLHLGSLDQDQFDRLVLLHYPEYDKGIKVGSEIMAADVISIVKTMQDYEQIYQELSQLKA